MKQVRQALICSPGDKQKLELRNQGRVIKYVADFDVQFEGRDRYLVGVLQELHTITVSGIYPCRGGLRLHYTDGVEVNADFEAAGASDIFLELPQLLSDARRWNDRMDQFTELVEGIGFVHLGGLDFWQRVATAADVFHRLLLLHPFRGGNGRVSRAFLHLMLADQALLRSPDQIYDYVALSRDEYLEVLPQADEGDLSPLIQYLARGLTDVRLSPAFDTLGSSAWIAGKIDSAIAPLLISDERKELSCAEYFQMISLLSEHLHELLAEAKQALKEMKAELEQAKSIQSS